MTKQVKHTIAIVLFCQFLICLGMSLIFPVMPFIRNEYHFSAFDMGMMSSLFALAQFIASPIVGRVSDKMGRKPMLVWGLIVFALAEFVFAATSKLWLFDLSRIVDGLSASFSGGLMLGPGLGGLLAGISYKMPFWVAGVLGLASAAVAMVKLPKDEDEKIYDDVHPQSHSTSIISDLKKMATPSMTILFIMILVSAFGLAGFESIYSLYVNQVHHFSLAAIAGVLTINGLLSLLLQAFLFDQLVVWVGEMRIIRWGFLLSVIGTIFVIYDHSHWQIFVATLVVYEAFDMLRPAITTLLTKMSEENQGLLNGINMSLTSVGNIVGPLLSGALLDMNYQYPYWVVSVFLMAAFFITLRMHNRPDQV